ncbi:MAG: ATP-dependent helicase [Minisyncoccia bacterium]
MKYLDGLNPAQRQAALHLNGPLLVIAGAGAGKTKTVAHRILHIVASGTAPGEILAITFTNKAAREMRERVFHLLQSTPELSRPAFESPTSERGERGATVGPRGAPFVSTFHSLGLAILKEQYRAAGFTRLPAVYDRADSLRTIKQALKDIGAEGAIEPRAALSMLSRAKGDGISSQEFEAGAQSSRQKTAALAWGRYDAALARDQALDFDDILSRAVALLTRDEGIRAAYQNRWRYMHIDEYQDTNAIQARLADLLLGEQKNICAVGDIDQTIYTWRGADLHNMLSFERRYPGARAVLLEENYRSTKTILAAANDIINKNAMRVEKQLFTKNEDGAKLSVYQGWNEEEEAAFVARKIGELIEDGAHPRDAAVLYRANFQSRAIEEALLAANIPYQVLGTRFFERAEVKDCLALVRASVFGTLPDLARAAGNRPGLGKTSVLSIVGGQEDSLRGNARQKAAAFRELLSKIAAAAHEMPPSKLIQFVVRESGMEKELREDGQEGMERLENLRELSALASRYDALPMGEALQQFLESAALASDQDEMKEERDAVRLMTVHASKGLEFPYVFVTGLEEGLFPYVRDGEEVADQEEERRLMYVAVTRAKKKVFLACAMARTVFGSQSINEPSRFIADISPDLIEQESPERLGRTIYLD